MVNKMINWAKLWRNQFWLGRYSNKRCGDNDKVLIIRLDAIGDFIIWLDSAKEYRSLFPNRKCILLCSTVCGELAEATGYFDEIITLNIKRFDNERDYMRQVIDEFASHEYGYLIQTAYSRTPHMDLLAASIPAHIKIGFEADESRSNLSRYLLLKSNKRKADSFYDRLMPAARTNLMELRRNEEFIRGLGKRDYVSAVPCLPHTDKGRICEMPYFVVFPGASSKVKMWRLENYIRLIDFVQGKTGWLAVVCGGEREDRLFSEIADKVRSRDCVLNCCGKTSLVDLIGVVRNAELVLSNDTNGIHYAIAAGVPAVCPFGEYNYGRFLPYDCRQKVSSVSICSAGMPCRNCAERHMTLRCIMHVLRTGRYLCLDKVSLAQMREAVEKYLL